MRESLGLFGCDWLQYLLVKYYYLLLYSIVYDMKLNALTVSESCVRQRVIPKPDDPIDRSR